MDSHLSPKKGLQKYYRQRHLGNQPNFSCEHYEWETADKKSWLCHLLLAHRQHQIQALEDSDLPRFLLEERLQKLATTIMSQESSDFNGTIDLGQTVGLPESNPAFWIAEEGLCFTVSVKSTYQDQ